MLAEFKADVINTFIRENKIQSVIEFGCGDGNQLSLAEYESYLGFDVSDTAVRRCREHFSADSTKSFHSVDDYSGQMAELALSLDVIYHLIEDDIFDEYMRRLFSASLRFVIIYSSNWDDKGDHDTVHIWHRKFTDWVDGNAINWKMISFIKNIYAAEYNKDGHESRIQSNADFYVYAKNG